MTTTLAVDHYLLFRPKAHLHQRKLGVRPEGVDVAHTSDSQRREIIETVNKTWDEGIEPGMQSIPNIIAPGSHRYLTHPTTEAVQQAKAAPILFLWLKADNIMPFRTKGAVYAIAFAIWSTPTNQILDLALLLTRFQDMYIRENDYTTFNLVNLSYRVCEVGTYGLLLYDNGLAAAYHNAELTSNATLHDFPVSAWPPNANASRIIMDSNIYELLQLFNSSITVFMYFQRVKVLLQQALNHIASCFGCITTVETPSSRLRFPRILDRTAAYNPVYVSRFRLNLDLTILSVTNRRLHTIHSRQPVINEDDDEMPPLDPPF
ncbi:hypothetical protein C8F01DRAFT_1369193 [Mycena amicta]|nr:hypothetical protein C8F01DRAFT_1369193 [Mycena amicta]